MILSVNLGTSSHSSKTAALDLRSIVCGKGIVHNHWLCADISLEFGRVLFQSAKKEKKKKGFERLIEYLGSRKVKIYHTY